VKSYQTSFHSNLFACVAFPLAIADRGGLVHRSICSLFPRGAGLMRSNKKRKLYFSEYTGVCMGCISAGLSRLAIMSLRDTCFNLADHDKQFAQNPELRGAEQELSYHKSKPVSIQRKRHEIWEFESTTSLISHAKDSRSHRRHLACRFDCHNDQLTLLDVIRPRHEW
jgi:hypothetical protein